MSNYCQNALESHAALSARTERSLAQLQQVRAAFEHRQFFTNLPLSVFCAGSLARREVGRRSDLDLFVTADVDDDISGRLFEYTLFAELIDINRNLQFPEFSNDGQYLKIYFVPDLIAQTGSPKDDSDNQFTTRMLLILESEPLIHDDVYKRHLSAVLENYYRDNRGKKSFRPLFLLNDILRYWRTLCLNYEERRHDPTKPWRKKNVNLKFSRMVTVFSTVLPLVLLQISTAADMFELCRRVPLDRLARAIDLLDDDHLSSQWREILDIYEQFLTWKEDDDVEQKLRTGDSQVTVRKNAQRVSEFLFEALTHDRIPVEFRRYLVL